jgi:tyrosyl-tRNA synthetase
MPAPRLIVALGLETTTSNGRRVIEQGGCNVGPDRTPITDPKAQVAVTDGLIVRVGKRKIARVRLGP